MPPDTTPPTTKDAPADTVETPSRKVDPSLITVIVVMAVALGFLVMMAVSQSAGGDLNGYSYALGLVTTAVIAVLSHATVQLVREIKQASTPEEQ